MSLSAEKMGNLCCCVQVDQSSVAIKETFGKFEAVLDPGCHCLPWFLGSQLAGHLSLRLQQLDVRCETKTKVCLFTIQTLLTLSVLFFPFYFYKYAFSLEWAGHIYSMSLVNHEYAYKSILASLCILSCLTLPSIYSCPAINNGW